MIQDSIACVAFSLVLITSGCGRPGIMDVYSDAHNLAIENRVLESAVEYQKAYSLCLLEYRRALDEHRKPAFDPNELSAKPLLDAVARPENVDQAVLLVDISDVIAPTIREQVTQRVAKMFQCSPDKQIIDGYYRVNRERLSWNESKGVFAIGSAAFNSNKLPAGFEAIAKAGFAKDGCPWRIRCLKDGSEMMYVTAGNVNVPDPFLRGGSEADYRKYIDDHRKFFGIPSSITGFYMDKYPITIAQYLEFCSQTNHPVPNFEKPVPNLDKYVDIQDPNRLNIPVMCVSYDDAQAYARWAWKAIPTPGEVMRAALGDTKGPMPWGAVPKPVYNDSEISNLSELDQFAYLNRHLKSADGKPVPIGRSPKGASPFGIEEMLGNVRQWMEWSYKGDRGDFGSSFIEQWQYARTFKIDSDKPTPSPYIGIRCVLSVRPGNLPSQ